MQNSDNENERSDRTDVDGLLHPKFVEEKKSHHTQLNLRPKIKGLELKRNSKSGVITKRAADNLLGNNNPFSDSGISPISPRRVTISKGQTHQLQ